MQIKSAKELKVYQLAYELTMEIYRLSKEFPAEVNEFTRSLGEKTLEGALCEQADGLRWRECRDRHLPRLCTGL